MSFRYILGGFISLFMALISFGIAAMFGIGMLLAETFGRSFSPSAGLYATQDSLVALAGIVGIIVFLSLAVYCFIKGVTPRIKVEVREYSQSQPPAPIQQAPTHTFKRDPMIVAAKSLGISTEGKTKEELANEIQSQTARTKVCPKCGVQFTNMANYCDSCGSKL